MKDRSEGGFGNESEIREKVFERERDEILVGGEERDSRDELSKGLFPSSHSTLSLVTSLTSYTTESNGYNL